MTPKSTWTDKTWVMSNLTLTLLLLLYFVAQDGGPQSHNSQQTYLHMWTQLMFAWNVKRANSKANFQNVQLKINLMQHNIWSSCELIFFNCHVSLSWCLRRLTQWFKALTGLVWRKGDVVFVENMMDALSLLSAYVRLFIGTCSRPHTILYQLVVHFHCFLLVLSLYLSHTHSFAFVCTVKIFYSKRLLYQL